MLCDITYELVKQKKMPGLKRIHATMDTVDTHGSRATNAWWKGCIIKTQNKQ